MQIKPRNNELCLHQGGHLQVVAWGQEKLGVARTLAIGR